VCYNPFASGTPNPSGTEWRNCTTSFVRDNQQTGGVAGMPTLGTFSMGQLGLHER